ncbi:MAG: hypothetical protein JNG86_01005, partial [Verrucomicrobiaceae bacterium]|nr:hypothetical protein [Verrucomicrobiaceae bacterium]
MKIPVILLIIPLSFGLTAGAAVISTSAKHRAEAVIDGKGSLARFGANTRASVGENGQVQLERGVMLVSSSDGFFRRSPVHVSTP